MAAFLDEQIMDDDVGSAVRGMTKEVECWFNFAKLLCLYSLYREAEIQVNLVNVQYGNPSVNLSMKTIYAKIN